jgi:hypothetical protein
MYKTCSKCDKHLSIDLYHKLKKGFLGRHSVCKICRSNLRKKKNISVSISEKFCSYCKEEQNYIHFYKNKNSNDGLQSYCKKCHKNKISQSNSKFEKFSKIILTKYKKKYKTKKINITVDDIIKKFNDQRKLCHITKHSMTHKSDCKQRTDNIWNMSIYVDNKCNVINYKDFNLVIHLIYTIQEMYDLSNDRIYKIYKDMIPN